MVTDLVKIHKEIITPTNIEGTVIDIETIGNFDKRFKGDSREYMNHKQVILGCLDGDKLVIYYACGNIGIATLQADTDRILQGLQRPFFAFNCAFESSVWFHHIGIRIVFDGELQKYRFEPKREAIKVLAIPNYDDPFYDNGFKCIEAWNKDDRANAIAHNRACLLKERDILLKRGFRSPDECPFVEC